MIPEQAALVFETHKPVFIDKPTGANLKEVVQVYAAAAKHGSSFLAVVHCDLLRPLLFAVMGPGCKTVGQSYP